MTSAEYITRETDSVFISKKNNHNNKNKDKDKATKGYRAAYQNIKTEEKPNKKTD